MKYTTKLKLKQNPPPSTAARPSASTRPIATAAPTAPTPAPRGPDFTAESPRIVDPGPV